MFQTLTGEKTLLILRGGGEGGIFQGTQICAMFCTNEVPLQSLEQ